MDKKQLMERIRQSGIVPVAVIDKVEKAVPLARAMLKGGVDVIEVTLRTDAAAGAIREISENCPDMLVGAGTVLTAEQCALAVENGAQFIICPGFSKKVVEWCVEHQIVVVPGCVTPSEIMAAMEYGIDVVKFFPADIYGGLPAMKALSGPFPTVNFIPTSGVNEKTIAEYIKAPYIFAAGGSWACSKTDIAAENYSNITALCADAKRRILGFELVHMGINCSSPEDAEKFCLTMRDAFGFEYMPGSSSDFSSEAIEVKKGDGRGRCGHLAIGTNSLPCAVAEMKKRGFTVDENTYTYKNGELIAVYLQNDIGGFAVHLMKKK